MVKRYYYALSLIALSWGLVSCYRTTSRPGATPSSTAQSVTAPPSTTPPLKILYNAEEQPGEKSLVAQTVQSQLKNAGIEVVLEPVPSAVYNDRIGKGQFECALTLWYLDYDDPEGFLTDFYSKSSYRLSKYYNPKFDQVYLSALFAPQEKTKFEQYHTAAKILDQELPWVPLYSSNELYLMRPTATGFRANAYQYYDYRWVQSPSIRAATDIEVQTLDPAQCYDAASKHLITQSYEGLIGMDQNNRIVPGLATRWKFSPSGTKLTFDLRADVKFHPTSFLKTAQQQRLDAGDVKATFERLVKANSPYSYIFDYVVGIDQFKAGQARHVAGFVVDGPLKFSIELKRAFPTMLPWLLAPATYILPAELPTKYDFAKGSAGTGPFVLESWNGAVAKFNANPQYWLSEKGRKLPLAQTLSIRVVQDANTLLLAYKNQELDILNVPLPLFDAVLDANGQVKSAWSDSTFREVKLNNLKFLGFNMKAKPWGQSPELRQRVSQAVNREEIVQQLFNGRAQVAKSVIPAGVAGFR